MGRSGRFGVVVSVWAGEGEEVEEDLTGLLQIEDNRFHYPYVAKCDQRVICCLVSAAGGSLVVEKKSIQDGAKPLLNGRTRVDPRGIPNQCAVVGMGGAVMHNRTCPFIESPIAHQRRFQGRDPSHHCIDLAFRQCGVPNLQFIDRPVPVFSGKREIHTDI
jgi:hypothetical protein